MLATASIGCTSGEVKAFIREMEYRVGVLLQDIAGGVSSCWI